MADFWKIDRLVKEFEMGFYPQELVDEINEDEDLRWDWGHENFSEIEFYFLVHESEVFFLHDNIEDYFERRYLLELQGAEVENFVTNRIESCIERGDALAVHYCGVSKSVVSAIGECRGQAGIGFVDFDITSTRSMKFAKLIDAGWLFLPNEHHVIPGNVLMEKYQRLIRERVDIE